MTLENCLQQLLVSGIDDWVQAVDVAFIARTVGGAVSRDEVRDLSVALIETVLERGWMEVGSLRFTREGEAGRQLSFTPWEIPVKDALARIEREWAALPEGPRLGDVCWLNLTKEGEVLAGKLAAGMESEAE